jgi:hypothetical protein
MGRVDPIDVLLVAFSVYVPVGVAWIVASWLLGLVAPEWVQWLLPAGAASADPGLVGGRVGSWPWSRTPSGVRLLRSLKAPDGSARPRGWALLPVDRLGQAKARRETMKKVIGGLAACAVLMAAAPGVMRRLIVPGVVLGALVVPGVAEAGVRTVPPGGGFRLANHVVIDPVRIAGGAVLRVRCVGDGCDWRRRHGRKILAAISELDRRFHSFAGVALRVTTRRGC